MKPLSNHIREVKHEIPVKKQIIGSVGILIFGILLGTVSKYLDDQQAGLPVFLAMLEEQFDFHNFLGRFAPWIFIAVCISVTSKSPKRAAINVFLFFVGMVSSYYLYSKYVAGFFPKSYALLWVCFTIASPFLAFICWYAKGTGKVAVVISAGIIGVLFNTTFAYGLFYFDLRYVPELVILLIAIWVLRRTWWETFIMIGVGITVAIIMNIVLPFRFW